MLDMIEGSVKEVNKETVLIDVGGFGLRVFVTNAMDTYNRGDMISIHTYLSITQNGVDLYGFREKNERELFKMIIKVPNVGPRTAFSLLKGLNLENIREALSNDDPAPFARVKGIGKKTAKRIILELKGKLKLTPERDFEEVIKALVNLGFSKEEAEFSINKVLKEEKKLSPDEMVERILKGI